jgi:hypothetical protein
MEYYMQLRGKKYLIAKRLNRVGGLPKTLKHVGEIVQADPVEFIRNYPWATKRRIDPYRLLFCLQIMKELGMDLTVKNILLVNSKKPHHWVSQIRKGGKSGAEVVTHLSKMADEFANKTKVRHPHHEPFEVIAKIIYTTMGGKP